MLFMIAQGAFQKQVFPGERGREKESNRLFIRTCIANDVISMSRNSPCPADIYLNFTLFPSSRRCASYTSAFRYDEDPWNHVHPSDDTKDSMFV